MEHLGWEGFRRAAGEIELNLEDLERGADLGPDLTNELDRVRKRIRALAKEFSDPAKTKTVYDELAVLDTQVTELRFLKKSKVEDDGATASVAAPPKQGETAFGKALMAALDGNLETCEIPLALGSPEVAHSKVSYARNIIMFPRLNAGRSGILSKWLKTSGDLVKMGDALCEVVCGNKALNIYATRSGQLSATVPEGQALEVGAIIGMITVPKVPARAMTIPRTPISLRRPAIPPMSSTPALVPQSSLLASCPSSAEEVLRTSINTSANTTIDSTAETSPSSRYGDAPTCSTTVESERHQDVEALVRHESHNCPAENITDSPHRNSSSEEAHSSQDAGVRSHQSQISSVMLRAVQSSRAQPVESKSTHEVSSSAGPAAASSTMSEQGKARDDSSQNLRTDTSQADSVFKSGSLNGKKKEFAATENLSMTDQATVQQLNYFSGLQAKLLFSAIMLSGIVFILRAPFPTALAATNAAILSTIMFLGMLSFSMANTPGEFCLAFVLTAVLFGPFAVLFLFPASWEVFLLWIFVSVLASFYWVGDGQDMSFLKYLYVLWVSTGGVIIACHFGYLPHYDLIAVRLPIDVRFIHLIIDVRWILSIALAVAIAVKSMYGALTQEPPRIRHIPDPQRIEYRLGVSILDAALLPVYYVISQILRGLHVVLNSLWMLLATLGTVLWRSGELCFAAISGLVVSQKIWRPLGELFLVYISAYMMIAHVRGQSSSVAQYIFSDAGHGELLPAVGITFAAIFFGVVAVSGILTRDLKNTAPKLGLVATFILLALVLSGAVIYALRKVGISGPVAFYWPGPISVVLGVIAVVIVICHCIVSLSKKQRL